MLKEILQKLGLLHKPLSIEQAGNIAKKAQEQDFLAEAKKKEKVKPTVADPKVVGRDLKRIIDHHIPDFGNWRQVKTLMKLRVNGASIDEIAFAFNVPKSTVMMLEAKGKEKIMKGIEKEPAYRVLPKNMNPKSRVIFPVS